MNTERPPSLIASDVGAYIFYGQGVFARQDLETAVNAVTDPARRDSFLGEIAAAPNVIVWHATGLENVRLDTMQKERLTMLSLGWEIGAMAKAHFRSLRTEKRKLDQIYDLLGASNSAAALTTAVSLGVVPIQRLQAPNRFTDHQLRTCRFIGLGLSNAAIGAQMGKEIPHRPREVYARIDARSQKTAIRRLFEMGIFLPRSAVVELAPSTQSKRKSPGLMPGIFEI